MLLFAYALSWGFAIVGLSAPNTETAQLMAFPILFPLTFASSAFVPVTTMPGWLQAFATHQPVTQVVNAARSLMVGGDVHRHRRPSGRRWPGASACWSCSRPLAVRKYRRRAWPDGA